MKKWMMLPVAAFVLTSCSESEKKSQEAADNNFTVTLSRGAGTSEYAEGRTDDLASTDLIADNLQKIRLACSKLPGRAGMSSF